jgi:hypothetical protein
MLDSAFELGEELNNRKIFYYIHIPFWERFDYPSLNLKFETWDKMKYLNDTGTDLSSDINNVPNDKGGLYMFYVKCKIIPGITEYPLYIGRAQKTKGQNLRKRVKEYWQHFRLSNERPKITKMIKYWGNDLYLAYYPLKDNVTIKDLEKNIINNTLFAMNDEIPDKEIKQAINAF